MATFNYKAMSRDGLIRTGSLEANNEADLEQRLLNLRLDLIKADIAKRPGAAVESRRVERRELILFCMEMAQLSRAGVPLLESLSDMRDSVESPSFREVIGSLIEVIESGESLSQAMADFPRIFDTVFVSLIKAGEASGRLSQVFDSLTNMIKWQDELANSTRKLMLTPMLVGAVVLGVTIFLMVYLVPQLTGFLAGIGQELPLHTRALIATSNAMVSYWYLWAIVPPLLLIGAKLLISTSSDFRCQMDKLKLHIPKLGQVLQKIILSRFANFFAMMYAAGIPVLASLEISEEIIDNVVIKRALIKAREDIEQGAPISLSLSHTGMFPPLVLRMIRIGEATGKLDQALLNVSYFYERDIKDSIDRLQALIQPAMTVVVGTLLGWVMISVLGPVYSSLSTMQI